MKKYFLPNFVDTVDYKRLLLIVLAQVVVMLAFFQFNTNEIMPKPLGIVHSITNIVSTSGFYNNLISTFYVIVLGMGMSIVISLLICYISFIPFFSGLAGFISKMRFLTYTGLLFVFTIILSTGQELKISLLLLGIIPYFTTSLLSYFNDIPKQEYELCYTLKMNRWQILYEVVIKGKLHLVLEVIKQNFAIAWMMITSVEGVCMSEGGLGTMMIKSNKYVMMNDVFAILIMIFGIGLLFDYLFSVAKVWLFPYTDTKRHSNLLINRLTKKK
jgi:ABC-type nitrate/sulfonate/bicarbonate transport system permease component